MLMHTRVMNELVDDKKRMCKKNRSKRVTFKILGTKG